VRSADLVPLLAGENAGRGVGFRQGTIVAWDPDTAENVVQVGTSLLENLPALNTSEASLLAPGDVVGILTAGGSWAILGRLIIPGSPEAASSIRSITNRIQASEDTSNGTRNSTSWGDLTGTSVGPAVTVRIGTSGRALAFWSAEIGQTAGYQRLTTPHVGVEVSGATTRAPSDVNALNANVGFPASGAAGAATVDFWIQAAMMHLFTGLTPGSTTFTLKYRHDTVDPSRAVNFQAREIAVFAL
jgi:hypothetical protein